MDRYRVTRFDDTAPAPPLAERDDGEFAEPATGRGAHTPRQGGVAGARDESVAMATRHLRREAPAGRPVSGKGGESGRPVIALAALAAGVAGALAALTHAATTAGGAHMSATGELYEALRHVLLGPAGFVAGISAMIFSAMAALRARPAESLAGAGAGMALLKADAVLPKGIGIAWDFTPGLWSLLIASVATAIAAAAFLLTRSRRRPRRYDR